MMLDWSRGEELGSYISRAAAATPGPEIQNPPRTLQRRAPVIKLVDQELAAPQPDAEMKSFSEPLIARPRAPKIAMQASAINASIRAYSARACHPHRVRVIISVTYALMIGLFLLSHFVRRQFSGRYTLMAVNAEGNRRLGTVNARISRRNRTRSRCSTTSPEHRRAHLGQCWSTLPTRSTTTTVSAETDRTMRAGRAMRGSARGRRESRRRRRLP